MLYIFRYNGGFLRGWKMLLYIFFSTINEYFNITLLPLHFLKSLILDPNEARHCKTCSKY